MRRAVVAVFGLIGSLFLGSSAGAHNPSGLVASEPAARTVQLITGDRVVPRQTRGRFTPMLLPADRHGIAGSMQLTTMNGDNYVLPAAAEPYLGNSLDPSLFNLTALATAERGGRLPVRLSYAADSRPTVPGLTVTSEDGRAGYFTATSARAFGRALVAQWNADHKPGHHTARALFGGVTRIGLDAPTEPTKPVARPNYPQVTLTVKVLGRTGKLDANGYIRLASLDNPDLYPPDLKLEVADGIARVSVPLGNYTLLGEVDAAGTSGGSYRAFVLGVADYKVAGTGQTLTLDTRKATRMVVRTPRPATMESLTLNWQRDSQNDGGLAASEVYGPGADVYVMPTAKPKVGDFGMMTMWTLAGTPSNGLPYTYDATFQQLNRITTDQTYRVATAQVAKVDSRYYTDGPSWNAALARTPFYQRLYDVVITDVPMKNPLHRIEYMASPPGVYWQTSLSTDPYDANPTVGFVDDATRYLRPGKTYRADWLRGPVAPGVPTPSPLDVVTCATCRTARSLTVELSQATDTTPEHDGALYPPSDKQHLARFRIYRNGKLLDDEFDSTGGTFPVPSTASTYRVINHVPHATSGAIGWKSSTVDITFRSAAGGGAKPPPDWDCDDPGHCTVVPILQARIPLPTDLSGQLPVGTSVTAINVGHVPGAAASAIQSARLQLSFNGGRTWRSAKTVATAAGKYRAVLTNPAAEVGRWVSLRLTATDSVGGKLIETVINAYSVGG